MWTALRERTLSDALIEEGQAQKGRRKEWPTASFRLWFRRDSNSPSDSAALYEADFERVLPHERLPDGSYLLETLHFQPELALTGYLGEDACPV